MALTVNYAKNKETGARRTSDYISARAAVTTSEQITVPALANFVVLAANLPFYVAFGANPTAVVAVDDDTGASSEMINPSSPEADRTFNVNGIAKIAVAAPAAAIVTAAFFR